MGRLVIEEDTVYEVDEECLCRKEDENAKKDRQTTQESRKEDLEDAEISFRRSRR